MSSLWLNIRVGVWHLQIGDPRRFSVSLSRNPWAVRNRHQIPFAEVCELRWPW